MRIDDGQRVGAWRRLEHRHRTLLLLIGTTTFFDGYDTGIISLALKQIRETFHLSPSGASFWLTFLYLGTLPALAVTRRADVIGRRRVLLWTIVLYTLATGLTAAAPTMAVFVTLQFFARMFVYSEAAIAWTVVAEELPAGERGFGFGFLAMTNALGVGFGAIVYGGFLQPLGISWRALYLVALPPLLLVGALRRRLPETRRFVCASRGGALALRWHRIFGPDVRRPLLLVVSTAFLFQLTSQASLFSLDFLQTERGFSASAASFTLIGAGLPAIPIMVAAGALSDRLGRRVVGCGFGSLGLAAAMAFFWLPGGLAVLLPSLAVVLVGQLASYPAISGYAVELFPTSLRSQASAWATVAKVVGSASSLALGGVLLRLTGSLPPTTTVLAAGPLAGILLVALFFPDTHRRELEETSHDELPLPLP